MLQAYDNAEIFQRKARISRNAGDEAENFGANGKIILLFMDISFARTPPENRPCLGFAQFAIHTISGALKSTALNLPNSMTFFDKALYGFRGLFEQDAQQ